MYTLKSKLEYAEAAFVLADIPDNAIFRKYLISSMVPMFKDEEEYKSLTYAQQKLVMHIKTNPISDIESEWNKSHSKEEHGYYLDKQCAFLRSYLIVFAKSEPDKDFVKLELNILIEHFEDKLIAVNDRDFTKVFRPLLKLAKSLLPKDLVVVDKEESPQENEKEESPKEDKNATEKNGLIVKFTPRLKNIQQEKLINLLQENDYVNNPKDFVDFLIGKKEGQGIEITDGSIIDVSYLLYLLYRYGLIRLNKGKDYQDYVETNICSFSMSNEKKQIKSNVSKVNRSHSSKHTTAKQLEQFVEKLAK